MADNHITAQSRPSEDGSAPADDQQLPKETRIRRLELYRAALNGDWETAEGIYDKHEEDISAVISKGEDTVLHIAAAAEHTDFVKRLVRKMRAEDLAKKNKDGNTAFCLASASGKVELAEKMMEKEKGLAVIRGIDQMLPIHLAASLGRKDMVKFLYQKTKGDLNHADRIQLLITLINTNLYDVALQLLRDYPELATSRDRHDLTALHALARKDLTSSNFANQNQQGISRRCFNLVSGAKYVDNEKLPAEALELVKELWKKVIYLSDSDISILIGRPWRLIFVAANQGNVDFLAILIREYPDILFKVDENQYSIFHIAVLYRQENIFKLIYKIGSFKDYLVMYKDDKGNNILHLAGKLAPSNRLNIVSGAALQLQRELLWFKEVSKVVQPLDAEAVNKEGFTPREFFTKNHEDLRENGEKWMKDTATSCMLVATLIATVVFAAAFTVPGGNKGDTGFPTFLQKVSFKIFAISDALSLIFSSASIVNFLSILTSRYAEEDFLELLPRKMLVGLATLFVSIVAMVVVFSTTFFIVFNDEMKWIAILVTALASAPVILFIYQQYHLFYDVLRSTCVSTSLFRSTCVSNSLFRPDKKSLFPREVNNLRDGRKSKQPNAHSTISTNV